MMMIVDPLIGAPLNKVLMVAAKNRSAAAAAGYAVCTTQALPPIDNRR
jgi:hypothetical protein